MRPPGSTRMVTRFPDATLFRSTGVSLVRRSTMRAQRMRPVSERKFLPSMAALLAFEAVGRRGGIRRAAKELMIDQAVVSRHVRALEGWTGAKDRKSTRLNSSH